MRVGHSAVGAQSFATEYLPRDISEGIAAGRFKAMHPRLAFDLVTGPVLAGFHTLLTAEVPASYPQDMAGAVLLSLGVRPATARKLASLSIDEPSLAADSLLVRAEARASRVRKA